MKLKFTCNWCSDKSLYLRILNNYAVKFEYFDLLTFNDDYDYLIIINNSNHYIKNKKKTIGLVMEPSWQGWNKNLHDMCEIVMFHDKNLYNHSNIVEWINCGFLHDLICHESFSKDLPDNMMFDDSKTKNISFICGETNNNQLGYNLRKNLISYLENENKHVDVFGRNIEYSPIKNKFGSLKFKYLGLINYKFSICIENSFEKNYITEKFYDTIMCNAVPIYCGAPNILNIFNEKNLIKITNLEEINEVILKINSNKIKYEDFNLNEAKLIYLNELNLINQVLNTIKNYNI